jgi:hypothetical protein
MRCLVTGERLPVRDDSADNFVCSIGRDGDNFCSSNCTSGVALAMCFVVRVWLTRAGALRLDVCLFGGDTSALLDSEAAARSAFPSSQRGILTALLGREVLPP